MALSEGMGGRYSSVLRGQVQFQYIYMHGGHPVFNIPLHVYILNITFLFNNILEI